MTKFSDLPDVLSTASGVTSKPAKEETAFSLGRPAASQDTDGLQHVVCRVYGRPAKPALADLNSRSVYPVKA